MGYCHSSSLKPAPRGAILASLLACLVAAMVAVLSDGPGAPRTAMAAEATAGTASGSLTVNGKVITLRHSYAMAQPNTFEKTRTDIAVLLTEKPLPQGALKDVRDLLDAAPKGEAYAFFLLNEEKKVDYEVISHPALGRNRLMMSSIATRARFTPKTFGNDRVEGSFETEKTETVFEHTYGIAVRFSALLLRAKVPEALPDAKTGTLLPADGGEPGKAYRAFVKAIHRKDIATIRRMAPQGQADMPEEELNEALDFFVSITPVDITISKGYVKGDRAALYVTGTIDKEQQFGTIEMTRIGGEWRPLNTSWSNTPPPE